MRRVLIKDCHFGVACLGSKLVASRPDGRKWSFQSTVENTAWHTTAKRIFSVSITTLGRPHGESGLMLSLMCSLWHNTSSAPCLHTFTDCRLWTFIRSETSERCQNLRGLKQHSKQHAESAPLSCDIGGTAVTRSKTDIPKGSRQAASHKREWHQCISEQAHVWRITIHGTASSSTAALDSRPGCSRRFFSHSDWPNFAYNFPHLAWTCQDTTELAPPYALSYADTPPLTFNPRPEARSRPQRVLEVPQTGPEAKF